jgi:hypothetical protein
LNFSLSNHQREILAAKANEKYSSEDIKANQIVNMPMTKLDCELELIDLNIIRNVISDQSSTSIAIFFFNSNKIHRNDQKCCFKM